MSVDGQHYALALGDGALLIRSKRLEEAVEEMDDEMKIMMEAFQPNMGFKQTAKNYKYFFRGQYDLIPEPGDIIASMQSKR